MEQLAPFVRPWRHSLLLVMLSVTVMIRIGRYPPWAIVVFGGITFWLAYGVYIQEWKKVHDDPSEGGSYFLPTRERTDGERYARALVAFYTTACACTTIIALIARSGFSLSDEDYSALAVRHRTATLIALG